MKSYEWYLCTLCYHWGSRVDPRGLEETINVSRQGSVCSLKNYYGGEREHQGMELKSKLPAASLESIKTGHYNKEKPNNYYIFKAKGIRHKEFEFTGEVGRVKFISLQYL